MSHVLIARGVQIVPTLLPAVLSLTDKHSVNLTTSHRVYEPDNKCILVRPQGCISTQKSHRRDEYYRHRDVNNRYVSYRLIIQSCG